MKQALLALLVGHTGLALAQDDPSPPPSDRNYVAVVVGLSLYHHLPDAVHLDFARSDAATVAQALREQAGFSHVYTLEDREATRDTIRNLLRTEVAQLLGPNDVFLFYFVGHGLGADLGLPVFLAHDSTLENGQEDGLELTILARDLQTWTRAGSTMVVTDAIHRNQLDGIYFYGPAASEWPAMPEGTMIISSSQAARAGADGAFGPAFAKGIGGAADSDHDRNVTASELFTYLVNKLSPDGQVPEAAGNYDGSMVIAQDVVLGAGDAGTTTAAQPPPETIYPNFPIDKAKFVWAEGASQSVQCRDSQVTACAPSCYIYDFISGPCTITAVVDGVSLESQIIVLQRGKYDCKRSGGGLVCVGP